MSDIVACIFDLDGVLVDTAKYHFSAWRDLAKEWDIDLTDKENEKLKGVSRIDSLKHILALGDVHLTSDEIDHWCNIKNEQYLHLISEMNESELLPNVRGFLEELSEREIKIGLGSASRNAPLIIKKTGIDDFFEAVVTGSDVIRSKPDPEVFTKGAALLGVDPINTIVFEDSQKGIEAAIRGGFTAVGVGREEDLQHADFVIPGFRGLSFEDIDTQVKRLKS